MRPKTALTLLAAGLLSAGVSAVIAYLVVRPPPVVPDDAPLPGRSGEDVPPLDPTVNALVRAELPRGDDATTLRLRVVPAGPSTTLLSTRDGLDAPVASDGRATVEGLAPGPYWVWFERQGAASVPERIDVVAGRPALRLQRVGAARSLAGIVHGEGGVAVAGAAIIVDLSDDEGRSRALAGLSAADGTFSTPPLDVRWFHSVRVEAESQVGASEPVRAVTVFGAGRPVPDGPVSLDLTPVEVTGRCVDGDGRPVVDGAVFSRNAARANVRLDGAGRFVLRGQRDDLGVLRVFGNEQAPCVVRVTGFGAAGASGTVDVGDVQIESGSELTGTLLEADGTACHHAVVTLLDAESGVPLTQTNVSESGTFSFPHVAAGTYRLDAVVRRSFGDLPRHAQLDVTHPAPTLPHIGLPAVQPVTLRFVQDQRPTTVRAAAIHVVVRAAEGGAAVATGHLEGVALDRMRVFVPVGGPYTVRVEVEGREPLVETLSVRVGEPAALNLPLVPLR